MSLRETVDLLFLGVGPVAHEQIAPGADSPGPRGWQFMLAALPALGIFTILYAITAWQCDDAYITHRTVENLLAGHGLRWQPAERVQSFTHPLWLLLLVPFRALTGEAYISTLVLSYLVSAASVLLLLYITRRQMMFGYLLVAVAFLSQAFIDYSSSGLENPLSHLLGGLIVAVAMGRTGVKPRPAILTGLVGLAMLNRIDAAVMFAPVVLVSCFPGLKPRTAGWCALALSPLIAWTCFSLFYYGFPLPNTAYAKAIGAEIPTGVNFLNAWAYYRATLINDPVTLPTIWFVCLATVFTKSRQGTALALGLVLYQVYLFHIGGDFMRGRFFSPPFYVALALAASFPKGWVRKSTLGALFVFLVGTLAFRPPFDRFDTRFGTGPGNPLVFVDEGGITDERAYYYPVTGMLSASRPPEGVRAHAWWRMGELIGESRARVLTMRAAGFLGQGLRDGQYAIDIYGLNDPLLARLPSFDDGRWKPGHPYRTLPRGYVRTHLEGKNLLEDPALRDYYELIRTVTRGPLLSLERIRAIVALNTGYAARAVDFEPYRHPEKRKGEPLARHYATLEAFNADVPVRTYGDRLHVHLEEQPLAEREVRLRTRHRTPVTVIFVSALQEIARVESRGNDDPETESTVHRIEPPPATSEEVFDSVVLFSKATDRRVARTIPEGVEPDRYLDLEIRFD